MDWLIQSLRQHEEIALFLVLALGYALGNLRLRSFKLGPVLGVLIAGIVVGQLDIPVSEVLKNTFFMLFLFAVGFESGPQFFQSLRATGVRQIVLTVCVCVTAFVLSLVIARLAQLDAGSAAGLMAGAMTGSAAFGAAGEAIRGLNAPEATREVLASNAAVSFAVCYLFGTVLVIWTLTRLGPWILGINLPQVCKELEQEMGLPEESADASLGAFSLRAYEVPDPLAGMTVSEIESTFAGFRVFIQQLDRGGQVIKPARDEKLFAGDRVAMIGRREAFVNGNLLTQHEVADVDLLGIGITSAKIVVSRKGAGSTLGELGKTDIARGIFLEKITRAGKVLPYTLKTPIEAGDVLCVRGETSQINRFVEATGHKELSVTETNMTTFSTVVFLGALIGLPGLVIAGVELSLTVFVGVLLGGLTLGWLSSLHPKFGGVPDAALWVLNSLGLAGFLGLVGMEAGPGFVAGLKQSGVLLMISAVVVVLVPHVAGILVGRYLLRLHPGIVLGACAGAGTSAPALGAIVESAQSRVPALSYGVGYAIGNVLLAFGASMLVKLIG
ncbi:MAG TPA: TrkA C-terminal domain-containing protein [Pyrinomonadaceae bacterium]|nr:TrkA C-terminal domain-containing protein [Pyrinomonadaceae bacterium]